MGLSFRQVIVMLATEQVLTTGAAVVGGSCIGALTNRLFIPLFQYLFDSSRQVPPFRVMIRMSDMVSLYSVVFVMIVMGLVILGVWLSRIQIHQALKLGED